MRPKVEGFFFFCKMQNRNCIIMQFRIHFTLSFHSETFVLDSEYVHVTLIC